MTDTDTDTEVDSGNDVNDLDEILNKPLVWIDDDEMVYYRASGMGSCINALIYARLEYEPMPPPKKLKARMDESSAMEAAAIDRYISNNVTEVDSNREISFTSQTEYILAISDDIAVIGHSDGELRVFYDGKLVDEHILEIKNVGESFYRQFQNGYAGVPVMYQWQISVYMLARKLPLVLYVVPKDSSIGDPIILEYGEPPISYEEIEDVISKVEAIAETGTPNECDGKGMFPCPFFPHHVKTVDGEVRVRDNQYIEDLLDDWKSAKEEEGRIKANLASIVEDRKNLERELFNWMRENGDMDVLTTDKVSVKKVQSHSTFPDWKKMESDGIDVEAYKRKTYYHYAKILKG